MFSLNYIKSCSENGALDLCVRKVEKRPASAESEEYLDWNKRCRLSSVGELGLDLSPVTTRLDDPHPPFMPAFHPDYSAALTVLPNSLYPNHLKRGSPENPGYNGNDRALAVGSFTHPTITTQKYSREVEFPGRTWATGEGQPRRETLEKTDYSGNERGISSDSPSSPSNSSHMSSQVTTTAPLKGKPTRPFKAYPKNPLSLMSPGSGEGHQSDSEDYAEYRQRMLAQVQAATKGNTSNNNMKRPVNSHSPMSPESSMDPNKDSAYRERRRKNNEAAKRSRDARRAKEDELAIRAAFLEQQYAKVKYENIALKEENTRLRCMLFSNS